MAMSTEATHIKLIQFRDRIDAAVLGWYMKASILIHLVWLKETNDVCLVAVSYRLPSLQDL